MSFKSIIIRRSLFAFAGQPVPLLHPSLSCVSRCVYHGARYFATKRSASSSTPSAASKAPSTSADKDAKKKRELEEAEAHAKKIREEDDNEDGEEMSQEEKQRELEKLRGKLPSF